MPAASTQARPVDDAELDVLFRPIGRTPRLGVAVSGGPDSTALLLLLDRHARRAGGPSLHVFTVDHGLRTESSAECAAVAHLAERLGHPASILVWNHGATPPPAADLQAEARAARYRLLAEAARSAGIDAIALGHTLDDQAETFLMRLARGSGVWGLAGMPTERWVHGIRFVRPLLGLRKERLIATCEAAGAPFAIDPSNRSDRFLRVRTRRLIPLLADIGLDEQRLAETAARLARAAGALGTMVADLRARAVADHGGVVRIDPAALLAAPDEVALRLLSDLIRTVRPGVYPPRAAPLEDWLATAAHGSQAKRTIAGVVLDPRKSGLWLYAEAGRAGFPELMIDRPGTFLWDERFTVTVTTSPQKGVMVRPAKGGERRTDVPAAAAATLPVAWDVAADRIAEDVAVVACGIPDGELG